MNPIIALTDFSPAADNAALYAAALAQKLNTSLWLVHAYTLPVNMNEIPPVVIPLEELKNNADDGLKRVEGDIKNRFPDLPVKAESRLGDIKSELEDITENVEPFAVVVGTHPISNMEQLLFGSTTFSIIKHSAYPVIAVPHTYHTPQFGRAVFATDLHVPAPAASQITRAIQTLGASLEIVHVETKEEKTEEERESLQNLFSSFPFSYQCVKNKDVKEGIEQFLAAAPADLLIVVPHKHSWLESFFTTVHTKELVKELPIPVLCIPEKEERAHL